MSTNKESWFIKTFLSAWYVAFVLSFFVGIISFFHIDSYIADKHHLNPLFLIIGIAGILASAYFLFKANQKK